MPLRFLHHQAKKKRNRNTEYIELLTAQVFSSMSLAIVAIFLPIYLLELGASLFQVGLYFSVFYLMNLFYHSWVIPRLVHVIGLKHAMGLSFMLSAAGYLVISLFSVEWYAVGASLLLIPLAEGLKFVAQELDLMLFTDKKREGIQVGLDETMQIIGRVAGPVIAGTVTVLYGVNVTLFVGACMLVLSGLPLYFTSEIENKYVERKEKRLPAPTNVRLANMGHNFESITSFLVWPIFVYLLLQGDFAVVGIFFSAGFVISVLATLVLSHVSDKNKKYRESMSLLTALWRSAAHIFRIFTFNVPTAVFTNSFGEVGSSLKNASFRVKIIEYGKRSPSKLHYVKSLEISGALGRLMAWAMFTLAYVLIAENNFYVLFALAAMASLYISRVRSMHNVK